MTTPPATDPAARLRIIVFGLLAAILTVVLLGMIGGGVYLLSRAQALTPTYSVSVTVADAGGVDAGTAVRMAGVPVGLVERATVQRGQALLRLRIRQEDQIPAGSRFVITPALFSMPTVLKIMPPAVQAAGFTATPAPGTDPRLAGGGTLDDPMASLAHADAMMDQWSQVGQRTSRMLDETTRTTRRLNALVSDGDTRRQLRQTLTDVQSATRNGAQATAQVTALLRRSGPPSQALLTNLSQTSAQINSMTRAGRPQVAAILASTAKAAGGAARMTTQGSKLLTPSAAAQRQVASTLADLSATVANLKAVTGKMSAIAGNVQAVSGDPRVAGVSWDSSSGGS